MGILGMGDTGSCGGGWGQDKAELSLDRDMSPITRIHDTTMSRTHDNTLSSSLSGGGDPVGHVQGDQGQA